MNIDSVSSGRPLCCDREDDDVIFITEWSGVNNGGNTAISILYPIYCLQYSQIIYITPLYRGHYRHVPSLPESV